MAKAKKHVRRRRSRKLKKGSVFSIFALLFFLAAGIITLSFFQSGTALDQVHTVVTEKFGMGGIMLPLILLSFFLLSLRMKAAFARPNVTFGLLITFICVITLARMGTVGEEIWTILSDNIGGAVSFFILSCALFIGLVILFNMSFEEVFKMFGVIFDELGQIFGNLFTRNPKSMVKPAFSEKLTIKAPLDFKTNGKKDEKFNEDKKIMPVTAAPPVPAKTATSVNSASGGLLPQLGTNPITNGPAINGVWEYPPLSLLNSSPGQKADRGDLKHNAMVIEKTLESFGINARVVEVNLGPAVTQYALEIALGTKVSKITSLSNDLALALAAPTGQIRIEAPIPGRSLVGIEIPNRSLEFVTLRQMLTTDSMKKHKDKLIVAMGLDVSGNPIVGNISKMPHVLVAGTTGSGKSVLVNAWISSLLFRTTPAEVRLILVDPKRVELTGYNGIPHLLTPVIVEPDKILSALRWATQEMDRRYKMFAEVGVKNIDGYNDLSGFQAAPYIVIFIDELADLMAYAPVEVEDSICRLAQMSRATGIHLVLATQRPSVDVITGLIKANVPARIAFNVSSMIDSRVIIDGPGAEKLLGRGDMLYIPPDQAKPTRIQGTYVSEHEVHKLVDFLKAKNAPVEYTQEVTAMTVPVGGKKGTGGGMGDTDDDHDNLFEQAVRTVCQYDRASASLLQRKLSIGYARAARIIDQLEEAGVIGPGEGAKPRDVLVKDPNVFFATRNGSSAESSAQVTG